MVCKIKNFALLAGALLVLFGMSASAVSAASFTAEKVPTTFKGVEETTFIVAATGLNMTCGTVQLHGTVEAASVEEVVVTPVLTECKTQLNTAVTVTGLGHLGEVESCQLVMKANGTGDLVCPPEVEVVVHASTCVIHLPPQSGVKTFTFTKSEVNGKTALTVDVDITNLHGTHTDGFLCPFNGGGTFENTKAVGIGTVVGEDGFGNPVGIAWDE